MNRTAILALAGACFAAATAARAGDLQRATYDVRHELQVKVPEGSKHEALRALPERSLIGYGAVNPRTSEIESAEEIVGRVKRLGAIIAPDRIHLNPDCGFGTFADRPVAGADTACAKLLSLARAAESLRASARRS